MVTSSPSLEVRTASPWQIFFPRAALVGGDQRTRADEGESVEAADLAGRIDEVERRMASMDNWIEATETRMNAQILHTGEETREAILAIVRAEVPRHRMVFRPDIEAGVSRLKAEVARVRAEMAAQGQVLGAESRAEAAAVLAEMAAQGKNIRDVVWDKVAELRTAMAARGEDLCAEVAEGLVALRKELYDESAAVRAEASTATGDLGVQLRSELAYLREEMYALHQVATSRADRLENAVSDGANETRRLEKGLDETRRHMSVLYEDVLARLALIAEGRRNP
jgi:predicted  nucleic acid-binding Zn-ribbon protein